MSPLSQPDQFKSLPGGVSASIARIDGSDVVHGTVLGNVLCRVIEDEAKAHDANFNGSGFDRVIEAIKGDKVQAYLVITSEQGARPQFVGGAIEIPTVITEWNGTDFQHYPAIYGEDTCVSAAYSKTFRQKTGIGLGSYFMHERIRSSLTNELGGAPYGMISRGRVAEIGADNLAVERMMNKLGGTIESSSNPILQFKASASELGKRRHLPVQIQGLASSFNKCTPLSNVFIIEWAGKGGKERIAASFTEAISTFSGDPIIRVQFTSNGNLPLSEKLKDVLANLILEGREEALERKWLPKNSDALSAMRFHAVHEPEIITVLKGMGAEPRLLGSHPMVPVITDLRSTPDGATNFPIPPADPLTVIKPATELVARPIDDKFRQHVVGASSRTFIEAKL